MQNVEGERQKMEVTSARLLRNNEMHHFVSTNWQWFKIKYVFLTKEMYETQQGAANLAGD